VRLTAHVLLMCWLVCGSCWENICCYIAPAALLLAYSLAVALCCAVRLQAISNLSPWLHFGQLSPQRAALEAAKLRGKHRESVEGFLEELVRMGGGLGCIMQRGGAVFCQVWAFGIRLACGLALVAFG
jgi:hypothetical protein